MSFLASALYTKNVPPAERAVRIVLALGGVAAAFVFLHAPWNWVGAMSALGFAMTGVIGFCPACALVGRRG